MIAIIILLELRFGDDTMMLKQCILVSENNLTFFKIIQVLLSTFLFTFFRPDNQNSAFLGRRFHELTTNGFATAL